MSHSCRSRRGPCLGRRHTAAGNPRRQRSASGPQAGLLPQHHCEAAESVCVRAGARVCMCPWEPREDT